MNIGVGSCIFPMLYIRGSSPASVSTEAIFSRMQMLL